MTDWLSINDTRTTPALRELRSLAASAMRAAVALPAQAYTGGGAKAVQGHGPCPEQIMYMS